MALNNADVLRVQTRINALRTQINNLVTTLNGADPNAAQELQVQQAALNAIGQLTELVRIIEISRQQTALTNELDQYRS